MSSAIQHLLQLSRNKHNKKEKRVSDASLTSTLLSSVVTMTEDPSTSEDDMIHGSSSRNNITDIVLYEAENEEEDNSSSSHNTALESTSLFGMSVTDSRRMANSRNDDDETATVSTKDSSKASRSRRRKKKKEDKKNTANIPDSFESYIVVSVLTATASFAALLDDNPDHLNSLAKNSPMVHNLAVLLGAVCTLSGMYATVVFSFSSIYGRTAIGNGRIAVYETFLKETSGLRQKAFRMYLLSLALFIVLLIIAATDKIDPVLRKPFLGLLCALCVIIYNDWSAIIVAAAPIFAAPPKQQMTPTAASPPKKEALPKNNKTKNNKHQMVIEKRPSRRSTLRMGTTPTPPPQEKEEPPGEDQSQSSRYSFDDHQIFYKDDDEDKEDDCTGCWAVNKWTMPSRSSISAYPGATSPLSNRSIVSR